MEGYSVTKLLPGVAHAVTSIMVGYPFDLVKTRLQTGMYSNSMECIRATYKDGWFSFYRGCSMPLTSLVLKRPLEFLIFENISKASGSHFVGGFCAGAFGTILGCPFSVVKIKSQNARDLTVGSIIRGIYREAGPKGFFKGLTASFLMGSPSAGLYLGFYGTMRDKIFPTAWYTPMIAGGLASIMMWSIMIPVDTVKTIIQASWGGVGERGGSIIHVVKEIYAKYGIRGFWTGYVPAIMRTVPVSGFSMAAYEIVKAAESPTH